jgi:hypothetical protein
MADRLVVIGRTLALLAVAAAGAACSNFSTSCDTNDNGNPPDKYAGGTVNNGIYMSSPWTGEMLWFPGGKAYDIEHKLGCVPAVVELTESFSPDGLKNEGSVAPCAGNMCLILKVDETVIRIKNDTCSDFYVRVTATGCESLPSDAGLDAVSEGHD